MPDLVIGIDPGLRRGTGIAFCEIGKQRRLMHSWNCDEFAEPIVEDVLANISNAGLEPDDCTVAIERMMSMGPRTGLQKILDNAQFVGELVGRLEAAGCHVVQLGKLEILRGLGIKGKAPATRVRQVVGALFGEELPKRFSDHEVDAMACAFVGWMKSRQRTWEAAE